MAFDPREYFPQHIQGALGLTPTTAPRQLQQLQEEVAKPLEPQEQDSLMQTALHKGLGGLHYVGSSLGKAFGGRAIRGALGGHWRELASVIPFSDTLGITDEQDEVHG